jgi:hypothetical protein
MDDDGFVNRAGDGGMNALSDKQWKATRPDAPKVTVLDKEGTPHEHFYPSAVDLVRHACWSWPPNSDAHGIARRYATDVAVRRGLRRSSDPTSETFKADRAKTEEENRRRHGGGT